MGDPGPETLNALLRRLSTTPPDPLTPADIAILAPALVPDADRHARALAYLCVSKLASSSSEAGPSSVPTEPFLPLLESTLGIGGFTPDDDAVANPLPLTYLLAALATLSPSTAVALLTHPLESVPPSTDALGVLLESAELPSALQPALAELLANLAGHKAGRTLVRERAGVWLRGGTSLDGAAGARCAVALAKLGRPEDSLGHEAADADAEDAERLARTLMAHLESGPSTIEGLAVLSTRSRVRRILASSPAFLAALLALSPVPARPTGSLPVTPRDSVDLNYAHDPSPVDGGLCYGLTTVLVNLTSRAPDLSDEDAQVARLKKMAIGKQGEGADGDAETDAEVGARVKALINAGAVGALHGLVRAESAVTREALGQLCLNLVHDVSHRPLFIQGGGYKVLSIILRDLVKANAPAPPTALPAAQALAKLAITTQPNLLFPPPAATTALNALMPLYALLTHPSARPLQTFEALMALTNLASISTDVAGRIVAASIAVPATAWRGAGAGSDDSQPVMDRVDELMLDTNVLVRRAAVELACNVAASEPGFMRFTGETADARPATPAALARTRGRLNVLVVLTDADDAPTRTAATGALAILTQSHVACRLVLQEQGITSDNPSNTWRRVARLLDPDPAKGDLAFRAAWFAQQLIDYVDTLEEGKDREMERIRESGIEDRLRDVLVARVQDGDRWGMVQPLAECLKAIKAWA
ncbi:SWI5-dependent HO expression protein 4 [Cryptotrichosporon argae]